MWAGTCTVAAGLLCALAVVSYASAATIFSQSCRMQQRKFSYIRCNSDDTFKKLQCNPDLKVCWCVESDGTRLNFKTIRQGDGLTDAVCEGRQQCPQLRCSVLAYFKCQTGFAEDSNGCMTCDCTVRCPSSLNELRKNCTLRCIRYKRKCPICLPDCSSQEPTNPCRCGDNETCVKRGFGWGTCKEKLPDNSTCERPIDEDNDDNDDDDDDDDDEDEELPVELAAEQITSEEVDEEEMEQNRRARSLLLGVSARWTARRFRRAAIGCRTGHYCKRTGLRKAKCQPRSTTGVCLRESRDSTEECDNNGFYKPRICRSLGRSGLLTCQCVFPNNGTRLPPVQVDTNSKNTSLSRKPTCIRKVYSSCHITRNGRRFIVQHGRPYIDPCNCHYCKCYFGQLYCSRRRNLCVRNCTQQTCTLPNGAEIQHGQSSRVDCNRCFCQFGRLYCTDRDCDNSTNSACSRCLLEPKQLVCSLNGRTYLNRCFAVNCSGISPVNILNGACPTINPCELFPCNEGEVCLRKGWSYCWRRGGCRPSTLRVCLNISDLLCDNETSTSSSEPEEDGNDSELGTGDVDPEDTRVCGTDGNTYSSICQLLQETVNVNVHYAGRCNSSHCRGGPVCGTDGITYENVCILRSQSSGVRVDYRGSCVDADDETVSRICKAVRSRGLCADSNSTCQALVTPVSGCCPICGGALLIALDQIGLQDAAAIDTTLSTLDNLIENIVQDDVFTDLELTERCLIVPTTTSTGNVELIFRAKTMSLEDAKFCHNQASRVAEAINSYSTATSRTTKRAVAAESTATFQYTLLASTASLMDSTDSDSTEMPGGTGSNSTEMMVPGGAGSITAFSLLFITMAALVIGHGLL